jgi:hypothetical protein
MLRHFILTVGVVSNHGNWFTKEDHDKELRVLAQSYDWLLFLTDKGLAQFVDELLLSPKSDLEPARAAFLSSYPKSSRGNRFTKVKIDVKADLVLRNYFEHNATKIEGWFNVITPTRKGLKELRDELQILNAKNWSKILSP